MFIGLLEISKRKWRKLVSGLTNDLGSCNMSMLHEMSCDVINIAFIII